MTDFNLAEIFFGTLTHDFFRYVIGAGGVWLVINLALAARLRHRKIRAETAGGAQMRREILASLRTVLIFALSGTGIVAGAMAGIFQIYPAIGDHGATWLVVSTVLIIVAHDAYFYWVHRALHRLGMLRRFHRLHHRSYNPTPFTSYTFDIGEALANAVFLPVALLLIPMLPIALLVFTSHMMLRNALGHSGVEIFPARRDGTPLFGWMTTVTHHDLHHSVAGYNFGLYFSWWDRWMGTEHPQYLERYARVARKARSGGKTAALTLAAALLMPSGEARADGMHGVYATPGLGFLVQFEPCADDPALTCGRIVWALDPASAEYVKVGGQMVTGLRRGRDGWSDGKLIDPETGSTYAGSIEPAPNGALLLSGCAALFICETQIWERWERLRSRLPKG